MRIYVRVFPGSGRNEIEKIGESQYKARLCAPPVQGRANKELAKLLAKHFKVAKSRVEIIAGKTSRDKIVEIHAGN